MICRDSHVLDETNKLFTGSKSSAKTLKKATTISPTRRVVVLALPTALLLRKDGHETYNIIHNIVCSHEALGQRPSSVNHTATNSSCFLRGPQTSSCDCPQREGNDYNSK